ncbi:MULTISPECIES: transketolase family protein [Pseudonocardia]|uniref:Transketolase n=2 Tax=Pseudonocardia TaxID=1847 RepID=A0ABQ0RWS2_9PSEU|nr:MULTISPECIES: transketolase [Pseudonocardia]OSY42511.1 putative 33.6 kDa protein in fasciation locus precursor [Pseudonocardia autotrophica]TDN76030.1 transketolase [Pseudonocardia autotrophica]BBG00007.1 transketolase [Pseudonocardia autotrophica]GEC25066.1 transketolase [Pseudonocardia saturnea]
MSAATAAPVTTAASALLTDPQRPADQRERFYRLLPELLADDPRAVALLADIGAGYVDLPPSVADRVLNLGIREQLLVSAAGGLALTGLRPIVHTFAPFLVERPYEQLKLDLGHQDAGAVLVSAGASYDMAGAGETHFGSRDVGLLDTLDGWTVHVPGHADEAETLIRAALPVDDRVYVRLSGASNARPLGTGPEMTVLRRGTRGTVVAVGPLADRVLTAVADLDVTVLYAATVRPFDAHTLVATLTEPDVVLVEPYLAGTSVPQVSDALAGIRHRVLGLGVGRAELRRYGTPAEHDRAHGLDVPGIRRSVAAFLS